MCRDRNNKNLDDRNYPNRRTRPVKGRKGHELYRGVKVLGLLALLQLLILAGAQASPVPVGEAAPGDVTFAGALALALESPAVALAETNLDFARRQLEVVSSPLAAEFSGGYTRTRGALESPIFPEAESLSESGLDPLALTATLNVVPFGPRYDNAQRARWSVLQAESAARDARADALLDASGRYLAALRAGQTVALRRAEVDQAAESLTATRTRREAGAANDLEVAQAEVALSQAQSDLAEAQRSEVQALSALSLTLGVPVAAVAGEPGANRTVGDVVAGGQDGSVQDASPESLLQGENAQDAASTVSTEENPSADALAARSDVQNAQLNVLEQELTAQATLRDNLPNGSLSLGYTRNVNTRALQVGAAYSTSGPNGYQPALSFSYDPNAQSLLNDAESRANNVSVNLSVSVPLDVRLSAALRAARLNVEASRMQAERVLELARLEVTGAQNSVAAASASLEVAQNLLEQSRAALAATQSRFNLGLISPLELSQAKIDAAEAELTYARAEDALLTARLELARALALDPLEVFR